MVPTVAAASAQWHLSEGAEGLLWQSRIEIKHGSSPFSPEDQRDLVPGRLKLASLDEPSLGLFNKLLRLFPGIPACCLEVTMKEGGQSTTNDNLHDDSRLAAGGLGDDPRFSLDAYRAEDLFDLNLLTRGLPAPPNLCRLLIHS